jgi:hypothetical protein
MAILSDGCDCAQTPVVLDGVQTSVLRFADRITIETIAYGRDLVELDYQASELPRLAIGPAVAAAIEQLRRFADGAGGNGGAR